MEFSEEQIQELMNYSQELGMEFFASVWDLDSVNLMGKYTSVGKDPTLLMNTWTPLFDLTCLQTTFYHF